MRVGQRIKNALIYGVTVALIAVTRHLPARLAVALGRAVGLLAALVARPERRRALANLAHVYPAMSARERRALVRRMFRDLGRSALECVAMESLRRRLDGPRSPVRFAPGAKHALRQALGAGRGVIYVTGHFGNWELMAAAVARIAPVHVLARSSYDRRFTALLERFRRQNGVTCIWVDRPGHLRRAVRALRTGAVLGVLLDQPVRQGGVMIPFLGHPAPTSPIVAALARSTGAAVVGGFIRRTAPGAHVLQIERLDGMPVGAGRQDLAAATRYFSSAVEQAIIQDPSQWAWSLDRWRSTGQACLSSGN